MKLFDGNYLFQTPVEAPSAAFIALTVAFGVLFVVSLFVYLRRARLAGRNTPLKQFLKRVATAGMWDAGIGLVLAAFRFGGLDYVGMRFWMYLFFLWMIAQAAYYVYQFSEHYPVAVYQLEQSHLQRRFRPVAKPRSEPQKVRAKVRGKRKR